MRIADYKPFTHHVENYELSFSILKDLCVVQSKFRIKRQLNTTRDARSQNSIELNGEGVQLIWLKVDGHLRPLETLVINTKTLVIPQLDSYEHTIEMETTMNPFSNKSLEGLYDSKGIISSQCEAESFRKITYFADRPDVMTTFKVRIEADQKNYPVLLSNGNLIEQGPVAGHRHFAVWEDSSRKPCYLFAMVAGDLSVLEDHFKTKSGKSVKLQFYASQDKISECQFALDSLKHAMEWDERIFDLEYDLDQYMVVSIDDFNAGAMENKGLNIFNSKYVLADQMSATDQDFEHIESVIAHEYFHNYSGNRITLRDWFHLSLKEGLTVFRDQEFSAERLGAAIQRVETVNLLKSRQFTEDAGPNRHPVLPFEGKSVDNFFTATIYEKGSEVIRMIQVILGKKLFQEVLKKYFRKFDGQAITILDFVQHFEEETSFDF
ncbi:MAG: aminopeptidase N, partial [Pseudobdellovibrionaceae bacterium]